MNNKASEAKLFICLGENYLDQGKLDLAVQHAIRGTEIAKEIKNDTIESRAYGSLAEMYRHYDQYELALKYNRMVIEKGKSLNNENLIAKAYNNLSATLGEMGRNAEAIDSLKKALTMVSDSSWFPKAKLNSNIGFCYRNVEEYDLAIYYHKLSLAYKRKANMKTSMGYSLGAIGRAYLGKKITDSAIYYIQQEYELATQFRNPHQIKDAVSHLSDAYEESGNYRMAFELLQQKTEIQCY